MTSAKMAHANLVERVVMKKLIVTGLRTCERKDLVYAEISKFIAEIGGVDEIVSGGSSGVDQYT
ncbi:MAG TPA: hypothetical protein PLY78_06660, partial [Methanospirillum sp.]|nr:hypothetical protein [Methanospirillum sp.]